MRMAHKQKGKDDGEDISLLRTPIQLHGKTVEQILNSVHYGTPELRSLLLDECDIIFECKVCRALFRDLPNLISHKRRYCSKSAAEDNYLALSRIPDEKVYVVQPQEPASSTPTVRHVGKSRSKPSLDETIARIQSGELGHSHAFKVYSDAAQKLQRQKEDMKLATIRTRAIPTNPNAVFVDVNMTSVNIHERQAATTGNTSLFNSGPHCSSIRRKAKERMNANKSKNLSKRVRILRKDCKNSGELQKMLTKELKEIQFKAKLKAQGNDSMKQTPRKGQLPKVKKVSSVKETALSTKTVLTEEKDGNSSDTGLIAIGKQSSKASPTKIESLINGGKHTPSSDSGLIANDTQSSKGTSSKEGSSSKVDEIYPLNVSVGVSSIKRKSKMPGKITQDKSRVSKMPSPSLNSKYKLRKRSLICQICQRIYSSKQSLSLHHKIIHSAKKIFFPCLYCPCVFYYFHGVTRHLIVNHSKTKAEVNLLRKKLRAKAYTKILSQVKEETDIKPGLTGLRKSARHKQEAFSSETSPTSSYVLHSVKKVGKKLSAKKDSMSAPQPKEQVKDSHANSGKVISVNSQSSSVSNSRNSLVKTEPESPPHKYMLNDATDGRRKQKTHDRKFVASSASPKSFLPRHSCRKCRRKFGRILTYKNHIKVCQGKVMPLSSPKKRGRPRKYPLQDTRRSSAVSTRSQNIERVERTPVLRTKTNDSGLLEQKILSNHINRSSSKDSNKSESLSRQENYPSEPENSCNKGKSSQRKQKDCEPDSSHNYNTGSNASAVSDIAEVCFDSVSICASTSSEIVKVKSEALESQSLDKLPADNSNITQLKMKQKSIINSSRENCMPAIPKSEKMRDPLDTPGSVESEARIVPQKVFNRKSDVVVSSPQTHDRNKKDDDRASVLSGKDGDTIHITRSSTGFKGLASSINDSSPPKTRSASTDTNKERRSVSVEKEVRSRISHLVPRASGGVSAAVKWNVSRSSSPSVSSTSPLEERPRRKRKIPTRNIDAMEMLSKIHNPEKDGPPYKNSEMNSTKRPRGRPPLNSKQVSGVKSQKRGINKDNGPNTERQSRYQETKDGRLTKNRSRIFVLGRNKPRGKKFLRSYDNARVDKLIDIQNSKCLVCGEHCTQIYNLRRHIIRIHLQWSRYQCKLCRFASFDRSECTTHIVRNHRRVVNIEDAQAVNNCISDLAKQGSQAMNMKKNQTIRDKSRQQTNETNIYARPNVRKMPRLAERTLIQEKEEAYSSSSPSPHKERFESKVSSDNSTKVARHSTRTEVVNSMLSENSSKWSSTPFNISTRNSPQVFDMQPCKISAASNVKCQGDIALLHTRKGIYTKAIPAVPAKDKCVLETKEMSAKVSISVEMKGDGNELKGKAASEVECHIDNDLPKHRNIFNQMGVPSINCSLSDESLSSEVSLQKNESIAEEPEGGQTKKSNSYQCEINKVISDGGKMMAGGKTPVANPISPSPEQAPNVKSVSNGPSSPGSSYEPKALRNYKSLNKDILLKVDDSHQCGVTSSSINASLSVSDPSDSSNTIRISPSYVVIKSARIPSSVRVSSGSVAKTLNFSQTSSKTTENCSGHSHSIPSDHIKETFSKNAQLDCNTDYGKSSSSVSALSGTPPEETQATITDVHGV